MLEGYGEMALTDSLRNTLEEMDDRPGAPQEATGSAWMLTALRHHPG